MHCVLWFNRMSVCASFVDNTTAYFYLLKQGGQRVVLNEKTREMFRYCWREGIDFVPT